MATSLLAMFVPPGIPTPARLIARPFFLGGGLRAAPPACLARQCYIGTLAHMRRLWLLMAFVLLVLIDLSILPTILLWVFVGSLLTAHGAPFLVSIVLALLLAAALIGLTFSVGRAWRRAPKPGRAVPSN
jgi:hypothetical protein